jgi:hypothetical protein
VTIANPSLSLQRRTARSHPPEHIRLAPASPHGLGLELRRLFGWDLRHIPTTWQEDRTSVGASSAILFAIKPQSNPSHRQTPTAVARECTHTEDQDLFHDAGRTCSRSSLRSNPAAPRLNERLYCWVCIHSWLQGKSSTRARVSPDLGTLCSANKDITAASSQHRKTCRRRSAQRQCILHVPKTS